MTKWNRMNKKQLSISNNIEEIQKLNLVVEELAEEWGMSLKISMNINLVLEEIITNIIFYGIEDKKDHIIDIEFVKEANEIIVMITDDGKAFNILEAEDFEDGEKTAEEREVGGLGIHFVKTLMDRVEYEYISGKNILTLHKKLS